jgi:4-amino-4-deoxy-L-arabinose transferase-like glycosyltransferase
MRLTTAPPSSERVQGQGRRQSPPWVARDRLFLSLAIVTAATVFLPFLGAPTIIDSSEGYYCEGAREMFESGDFVTPHLNYKPWFEKPILTYWLIAGSYGLLGVNEFSARLPAALCGILLVAFVYIFSRRFAGRRAALLSALVLLSTPLFAVVGHLSLTDMPFTFCVSVALGSLLCAIEGAPIGYHVLGYLALGLALLAKGPLALVLTALVLLPYLLWTSRNPGELLLSVRRLKPLLGAALVTLVAAPWYIAVSMATNGEFAREFFIDQNLGRAAGQTVHRNLAPWYYLPFVFGGCAPWSILLLPGLAWLSSRVLRRGATAGRVRLLQYCTLWLAGMFVFFSLVPTKLSTYILPVLPALAVIVGCQLDLYVRTGKVRRYAFTGALLVIAAAAALIALPKAARYLPGLILPAAGALLLLSVACLVCTFLFWSRKAKAAFRLLLATSVVATAVLVPAGLTVYHGAHQAGFHRLVLTVKEAGGSAAFIGPSAYSSAFYLRRAVPAVENQQDFQRFLSDGANKHWIFIHRARLAHLAWARRPARLIEQQGKWSLYEIEEANPTTR